VAAGRGGVGLFGPIPAPATLDLLVQLVMAFPGGGTNTRAVLNGLFGDVLAEQRSSLAIPLTFHDVSGGELPLDRAGLREAVPHASGRLCVLVHGLMSSDALWRFGGGRRLSYGQLLAREHGMTPVYVRYNTGRHISTNGRELAAKLQRLVRAWPRRVREVDLIGHSMGGLVVRSACHYGRHRAALSDRLRGLRPWPRKVRRVVLLGVPNSGASLEVIANLTSAALWSLPLPVTRLIGAGLDRRSEGIKDLRWGAVLDEDWVERDPGATERPERHPVHVPRRAAYLVVAGSLASQMATDPPRLVDRVLGDPLVTPSSAAGDLGGGAPGLFPNLSVRVCPRVNHIALANSPEVYDQIASWWNATTPPRRRRPARPARVHTGS
jgi:pimeloyl-ACP methyl ester carboxylesterase